MVVVYESCLISLILVVLLPMLIRSSACCRVDYSRREIARDVGQTEFARDCKAAFSFHATVAREPRAR